MSKSIWLVLVLVFLFVPAVSSASPAEGSGCPRPAMTPATGAGPEALQLVLPPPVSRAQPEPVHASLGNYYACCEGAYEECEQRCTQGIRSYWCEPEGCGPGCCWIYCDCWIFE